MKKKLEKLFSNKKIALLGLGLENQALLELLAKYNITTDITICDFKTLVALKSITAKLKLKSLKLNYQLKKKSNQKLDNFDILFRSPGWPLNYPGIKQAIKKKVTISSSMNMFFQICASKNIVGVTGSKGKGTTASLIAKILQDQKKKIFLGGNIGIAPLSFVDKVKSGDWIVLELSSFQLEDLAYSPKYSVITNLYPEHLSAADPNNPNFHKNFKAYIQAKLNIAGNQNNLGKFIVNEKACRTIEKEVFNFVKIYAGKITTFKPEVLPTKLVGDFNFENIGGALTLTKVLKLNLKQAKRTIKNYKNLEHRLEWVANIKKVTYYNNSFCTTPASTILDLKSFTTPIILIAGGPDKGTSFDALARTINSKVKLLILFPGRGSDRLKQSLKKANYPKNQIKLVNSMTEAVKIAKQQAISNDVVLLSPACASFGLFNNYKERGALFKQAVKK